MSGMTLLGIDAGGIEPGVHSGTGLTVLTTCSNKIELLEARQVNWDEWTMAGMLQHYIASYPIDLVVYESFSPQWGKKFELDTVYLNGAIKATVEPDMLMGVMPSAHKSVVKRDWAKHLVQSQGYKVEQGHKVDATSLCLYAGIRKQEKTILEEYKKWLQK